MKNLFGEKLHFDWKVVVITVVSTLLLMIDHYHEFIAATLLQTIDSHYHFAPSQFWIEYWDRVILYLIIPLIIILVLFRENPKAFGFSLGDWQAGLTITAAGILFMAPILYYLGRSSVSMQGFYKPFATNLPWTTFLDLIGWEFMFRGWILFGYARKFGHEALWLQAVPFAIAHIGKPEVEALSTIFGGFAFGWIAYRTKSFVWPFLIHWFIATFIIIVAAGLI